MTALTIDELVHTRDVIVCCGTGGVGKTTTSAALALAAARAGRRAVVVTIDPAKRLADALGIGELSNDPRTIEGDWPGELAAMMLDTKSTFDDLVRRNAGSEEQANRIIENRFYRNVSTTLSGTQDYMAVEKLNELHTAGEYDLVVVDTPPTRDALAFLEAPRLLQRLLDNPVYRILTAPTRGVMKVVNNAATALLRQLSRIVGADVVDEAVAFFQAFEGMEDGFRDRANATMELLAADRTAFVLVASPRADTIDEARYFLGRVRAAGLDVDGLVVNRVLPVLNATAESADQLLIELSSGRLASAAQALSDHANARAGDAQRIESLAADTPDAAFVTVPLLPSDVHNLDGLTTIADLLLA